VAGSKASKAATTAEFEPVATDVVADSSALLSQEKLDRRALSISLLISGSRAK
jgi:hypothetical protein